MMIRCSMLQVRYLVRLRSFEPTVPQILSCRIAKPLKGITDCRPDNFFFIQYIQCILIQCLSMFERHIHIHIYVHIHTIIYIYTIYCACIYVIHTYMCIFTLVYYTYIYIYISTRVHTDNVFAFRTMAETMQTVCTPKKRHMLQNLEK